MDTTDEEHHALSALALEVREPTPEEIAAFQAIEPEPLVSLNPPRDLAAEIDDHEARLKLLEKEA